MNRAPTPRASAEELRRYNVERERRGLRALTPDERYDRAALVRAYDQAPDKPAKDAARQRLEKFDRPGGQTTNLRTLGQRFMLDAAADAAPRAPLSPEERERFLRGTPATAPALWPDAEASPS